MNKLILNEMLYLESLDMQHADALFTLTDANRNYLRKWLPWLDSVCCVEDTQQFITSCTTLQQQLNYIIYYQNNMCGIVGFHKVDNEESIGLIGYWLAEPFTGLGIMSTAVEKIIELGFLVLNLNKIEIWCAEGNVSSRAIPERLSFNNTGLLKQAEWLYDRHVNHVVYSLLISQYKAKSTDCSAHY